MFCGSSPCTKEIAAADCGRLVIIYQELAASSRCVRKMVYNFGLDISRSADSEIVLMFLWISFAVRGESTEKFVERYEDFRPHLQPDIVSSQNRE